MLLINLGSETKISYSGLNFEFIGEFLVPKNNDSRSLNKAAFEKHDIEVLFQDDESGEFRDALKSYGILSDLN